MRRLLLFLFLLVPASTFGALPVGVVSFWPDVESCAEFDSGFVPKQDSRVTLIDEFDGKQRTLTGWISGTVPKCSGLRENVSQGTYYNLVVPHDRDEEGFVGIVVAAETSIDKSGHVTAELDGKPPREQFGRCTSYEGIHFRIWSGTPYETEFIWEEYLYLAYDVDPTCPDTLAEEDAPKKD